MSPFVLIIFGATGDLARHKMLPALFSLFKAQKLPEQFYVVGFSRRMLNDAEYRSFLYSNLQIKENEKSAWEEFLKHIYYQDGLFEEETKYEELGKKLAIFDHKFKTPLTRVFYLATPPDNYLMIIDKLRSTKLTLDFSKEQTDKNALAKIAIEKPFGRDLTTAREIDRLLAEFFEEQQVFRVDHYLAKETVQNMLAFRFANGIFEPVWNKNHIDHIQITFFEQEGVSGRGRFFDGIGILRDVAQNHLMQLIATVVMEQPRSFSKEAVRDARASAIGSLILPTNLTSIVRGQYETYHLEKDVASFSKTETFVAMKLFSQSPRFAGVPIYVRAGKKMSREVMEISVVFTQTCHILFKEYGCPEIGNVLKIRIQPDEGISLRIIAKTPGEKLALETIEMKFSYKEHNAKEFLAAYEKILLDIFQADQMLFNRSDELESSWALITNILNVWQEQKTQVFSYPDWSDGPEEAQKLIAKDNRKWL